MEFDIQKFTSQAFQPREHDIPVPALAAWFKGAAKKDEAGAEQPPAWKVRGLTGPELAKCNEAQQRNRNRAAIAEGLASGSDDKIASAIKEILGTGQAVPDDIAKRIEMLVLGSVEPKCSHQVAVKLADAFPVEFFEITTAIVRLTGQGGEPGKPKRSSVSPKSKPPSSSAT